MSSIGSRLRMRETWTAEPPVHVRAKSQNIHVSPAVIDAARKDGEELLQSLQTTSMGPNTS